ncbi:uncharacterized protein LOC114523694 isoform X2 [Dendronephthya gigantea]|uniref:uncharacterized protein LOC114523694 isoform X2 n=1 Tax=Dendronephthya gigantea TaxID=151771 RepID=UPI00106D940B|nr:uncharacterized protein LOC114523694 isoform X2 [Dendronephthya gigantea]
MASFAYPTLAVVSLFLSLAVFANENSTSSPGGKNVAIDQPMTNLNLTNTTNRCESHKPKLRISESDVKNIINAMHKYTTNGVEIELTIDSKNETRSFPKYKWSWAGEIGRTIISLITSVAGNKFFCFTLTPGIAKVNVVVSELTDGCLPTGNNGTELVFNFLLHQLSHLDDTHDYKLCHPHDDEDDLKQYNCCRITTGNLTICADYASMQIARANAYAKNLTSP